MKKIKILIITLILILTVSCVRIPGNYTPKGVENYIEADKKIRKENRQVKKIHRKMTRRINNLQHERVIPYVNR